MRVLFDAISVRQLLPLIFFLLPVFGYAQSSGQSTVLQNHTFSYSIVEVKPDNVGRLEAVINEIRSLATLKGGTLYAIWVFARKPADAPFAGLADNQMGLMLAWPNDALQQADLINDALQSIDLVATASSRLFEAIYLPAGLSVPTKGGFYVHREEKYSLENVDKAVRLSKEAWQTWEPHWGTTVIGLFREMGTAADYSNLNRIVWYSNYEAWQETRNFSEDLESAKRFKQRRTMLIPGSGIAIATDRLLDHR